MTEDVHPDKKLALYRIVQESINNILKHAGADQVFVSLSLRDETIHLTVEDNGTGFDFPEIKQAIGSVNGSLGLNIMKERAVQAGGNLYVETEKKKGTMVLAEIPLKEESTEIHEGDLDNPYDRTANKYSHRG